MSTEFVCAETEELSFVRWCSAARRELTGSTFEFGTVTNWETCRALAEAGLSFAAVGESCTEEGFGTAAWFERLVTEGRASFGEFGVTVEVGSGELTRFTQEG